MSTLLEFLDRLTPRECRLIAKKNGKAMTAKQISKAGDLNRSLVNITSNMDTFAHLSVGVASKFLVGCGIDIFRMRRHWEFLRRQEKTKRGMAHIRRAARPSYFRRLSQNL